MLFSSPIFLFAFLPIVLAVYYGPLRGMRRGQNLFLLLASLCFYGWAEPVFVLVMVGSILLNYLLGLWVEYCFQKGQKTTAPVVTAVVANLALLFVFKYLSFTLANLRSLGANLPLRSIALPIGISFFTFQALSYVLDVARKDAPCQKNPLDVGLYIAFFPQLIAGPIIKYRTVAEQIEGRQESWAFFSQGCYRFLIGLGKKVLLSNQLAVIADAAFGADGPSSMAMAWLGGLTYILQLYFDFGGYSDMAIGLGKMFGFQFAENFRYPYIATSITDFWRRWHISLTTWFRDYVYFPLGGSRVDKGWKVPRNLFVVWFLTGLWHGANWTFIVWGLMNFALLMWEKYGGLGKHCSRFGGWAYTFTAFILTCVVFRSDSLAFAGRYFAVMFKLTETNFYDPQVGYYLSQNWWVLLLAALACAPTATWLRGRLVRLAKRNDLPALMPVWNCLCAAATACILLLCAAYLVKGAYNPFIYFNF